MKKYMQGSFTLGKSPKMLQFDKHHLLSESVEYKRVKFPLGALSMVTSDGRGGVMLYVGRPGMHSLVSAIYNGVVYWDEYRFRLMNRMMKYGAPKNTHVHQVGAGEVHHYHSTGHFSVEEVAPKYVPTVRESETLEQAVDGLYDVMVSAAREMYELAGRPKVTAMLSGGTDSTLCALMLKEIGADFRTVSVGVSEDSFDAKYARQYAEQLGMPFEFIPLPSDKEGIDALLRDAVEWTEQYEMSNTLMAMCTVLVARNAQATGYTKLMNGYYADSLVALSNVSFGQFRKQFPVQTSTEWSTYRASLYQHTIPNDLQVAKVSRYLPDVSWFGLFYHPSVSKYVWETPIEHVPLEYRKPLFQALLDRYITDGAWHTARKVGYYTGSAIGKLRLDHPDWLGNARMSEVFKQVRTEHGL